MIFQPVNQDKRVEKVDKDTLYNEGLYWVIKLIETVNADERSAAYKHLYILLFNMLISAALNDPKKSSKTLD